MRRPDWFGWLVFRPAQIVARKVQGAAFRDTPILIEAWDLLEHDRADDYGDPVIQHQRIARVWSAILDYDITAEQVALLMAAMKIVRASGRHQRDDLADGAAYLEIADRCRPN